MTLPYKLILKVNLFSFGFSINRLKENDFKTEIIIINIPFLSIYHYYSI